MTRADFIQQYDQRNLFTIDSEAMVRADSVPMQNAMREICSQPGFEKHLEKTLRRLDDLESLARTRELVLKDLVKGGSYKANVSESAGLGKSVDISYVKGWTGWWSWVRNKGCADPRKFDVVQMFVNIYQLSDNPVQRICSFECKVTWLLVFQVKMDNLVLWLYTPKDIWRTWTILTTKLKKDLFPI